MRVGIALVIVTVAMDLVIPTDATAAGPATRQGPRVRFMEDGERGKVVRADEQSITIVPLPRMRLIASDPPEPPQAQGSEKTFRIDDDTAVSIGVVAAERLTVTGETIRTMEMHDASPAAIKPGIEVVIQPGDEGIARRVMIFPAPLVEPRDATTRRIGPVTRRARPATRPGGGSIFMAGTRGKIVRIDEKSIIILVTEGQGFESQPDQAGAPPQEKTFKLDDRTRVMIPRRSGPTTAPNGRSAWKISFEIGQLSELRPGQDVTIVDPTDEGIARRITVIPESIGGRTKRED